MTMQSDCTFGDRTPVQHELCILDREHVGNTFLPRVIRPLDVGKVASGFPYLLGLSGLVAAQ